MEVEVEVGHSLFDLILKRHGEVEFVEHNDGVIELSDELIVDIFQNLCNTNRNLLYDHLCIGLVTTLYDLFVWQLHLPPYVCGQQYIDQMASDILSGLLQAVKHPSANLTENANFTFQRGGGIKWHLEF